MPNFRLLKQSGIHRFAICSLFRTLLRGTRHSLISDEARYLLQTAIKDRFHRNHHAQSQQIHDASVLGQKVVRVLETLDSTSTSLPSPVIRLVDVVRQLYPTHTISKIEEARLAGRHRHEAKVARAAALEASAATKAWHVYERPMPASKLSGIRKVPDFVSASGFPFLRYAKPQPPYLSGMLRHWMKRRARLLTEIRRLQDEELQAAYDEDRWESQLIGLCGLTPEEGQPVKYVSSIQEAERFVSGELDEMERRRVMRTRKLWEIMEKEKALAMQENEERRQQKNRRMEQERLEHEIMEQEKIGSNAM